MKILQVNKHFVPDYGGATNSGYQNIGGVEKVVASFATGLSSRGHDVHVLACQGRRAAGVEWKSGQLAATITSSVGTYLSTPLSASFFSEWRRLRSWPDIVHVHEPFPLASLASVVMQPPVPIIVSWHADIVGKAPPLQKAVQWLQGGLCARASLILPTSLRIARGSRILSRHLPKCVALPIGIDLQRFLAAPDEPAVARLRTRFGGRFVLFVGRLVSYKGLDVLIEAMASSPEVCLVIAGEGPLENVLRADVRARGLDSRVTITGEFVPEAELADWYAACDFFVMPSTAITEGFGIVQIEAMASGRAVINTDLPTGVPEVSLDGISGRTVPVGMAAPLSRALTEIWSDGALRARFGAAGRQRAQEEFSEAMMVDRLIGFYRDALSLGAPRH
jgi:glycosyltransferase involved in cell wall biosynthesis